VPQHAVARETGNERQLRRRNDRLLGVGGDGKHLGWICVDDRQPCGVGREVTAIAVLADLIGVDQIDDRPDVACDRPTNQKPPAGLDAAKETHSVS
jgi:hypothetical protein